MAKRSLFSLLFLLGMTTAHTSLQQEANAHPIRFELAIGQVPLPTSLQGTETSVELESWRPRMEQWRTETKPEKSFLGVPYNETSGPVDQTGNGSHSHLVVYEWKKYPDGQMILPGFAADVPETSYDPPYNLLLANVHADLARLEAAMLEPGAISDLWLIYGDELREMNNPQLALLSWRRAIRMGHPRPDVLKERIEALLVYLWMGLGPVESERANNLLLDAVDQWRNNPTAPRVQIPTAGCSR